LPRGLDPWRCALQQIQVTDVRSGSKGRHWGRRDQCPHRKLLQSKAIAIENDLRGTLRNFGLKVGTAGRTKFVARIEELVEDIPDLAVLVEPLLVVRRALREQIAVLHRRLLALVRDDEVCRRLMTIPGVGPSTEETMSQQVRARGNDRDQHQLLECLRRNFIAHMLSDVHAEHDWHRRSRRN
jgi:transposase